MSIITNAVNFIGGFGWGSGSGSGGIVRYGFADGKDVSFEPENIAVRYTCIKILADNFSRLPLQVKDGNGKVIEHKASTLWNYRPNGFLNPQTMRSTSEVERNLSGNSFFEITPKGLIPIYPEQINDWFVKNGELTYKVIDAKDPRFKDRPGARDIKASKLLHFKGASRDGIMGLSPLVAAHQTDQLMQNATATVNAFYRNNAMSTMAIERTIPTGAKYEQVVADRKLFAKENAGTSNAGKELRLPMGEKIIPLTVKFADAELIKTLEFTRDTITSLYQVPNWMLSANDSNQNVEQQTRQFVSGTMANVANIYAQEIACKMLSLDELKNGYTVSFDLDALVEVTFGDTVTALKEAVTNGLLTPNEAIKRLGGAPIVGGWGDMNLSQAQYLPLQDGGKNNPLVKDSPVVDKNLTDNRLKNEETDRSSGK